MATVRVRIVILTVWVTLSVCPFNHMAHAANTLFQFFRYKKALFEHSWSSLPCSTTLGLT
jgi:hypothetical protein